MSAFISRPSLIVSLALCVACSSATPIPAPPAATSEAGAGAGPAATSGSGDAPGPSATPPVAAKAKKPETVQDCKDLAATPSDDGDSSAAPLPTGDAKSDRLAPMRDFIKSRRPG